MYIISKHKDYYDGVVGSVGMDKTLVYERNTEEITDTKLMPKEFRPKSTWGWRGHDRHNPFLNIGYLDIDHKKTKKYEERTFFIVGFCGKLYLGWKLYYKEKELNRYGLLEDVGKADIVYGYENVKEFLRNAYWGSNINDDVEYVMNYNPIHIFRELHTPVFIHETRRDNALIVNPCLKEWEFYKVVNTFQAFQEISMFMGGVLGSGEKEIIVVEDKYKIAQHGFDKWSFRKMPEDGKGN